MKTHSSIITELGATNVARRIGVDPNNVHAWVRSDSIPAPYWAACERAGISTLKELAAIAEAKARFVGRVA